MSVFKGTEKPTGGSELGEWREETEDIGRDKNMGLLGHGKESVFHTRGSGINAG